MRMMIHLFVYIVYNANDLRVLSYSLFIIAEEDLDRKPSISTHLEAIRQRVQLLDFLCIQRMSIKLVITLDS